MKKTYVISFLLASVLFASCGSVLLKSEVVTSESRELKAIGHDVAKPKNDNKVDVDTLYKENGKEVKLRDTMFITVRKLPNQFLQIRSAPFRVGRMPFDATLHFTLPLSDPAVAQILSGGEYTFNNFTGTAWRLGESQEVILNGTMSNTSFNAKLQFSFFGKKYEVDLTQK